VLGVGALGERPRTHGARGLAGRISPRRHGAGSVLPASGTRGSKSSRLSTGSTGFMVGCHGSRGVQISPSVLRKDTAERAPSTRTRIIPLHHAPSLAEDLEVPLPSRSEAANDLGCYSRAGVEALEGRIYASGRPSRRLDVINAYLMSVHWDETASCLMFEERERVDAGHTQKGRVYIPDGRPFMSFVYSRKGGHTPDHGVPSRKQRACTRSDHNAVKPGRYTFYACERSDCTQTRARPNASTWFHSARLARLRSLLPRTRDGDAGVRLLCGSSASAFGQRDPAHWTSAGTFAWTRRKVRVGCGHRRVTASADPPYGDAAEFQRVYASADSTITQSAQG